MRDRSWIVTFFGIGMVTAGFFLNPWVLSKLFSPDGKIERLSTFVFILFLDMLFIVTGSCLIRLKRFSDIRNALVGVRIALFLILIFFIIDFCRGAAMMRYQETPDKNFNVHVADTILGWRPKPNALGRHVSPGIFDVTYQMDADGFKKSANFPESDQSIYFFGDSFTFGHGVANRHTFPNVLASEFLTERINVFNLGVMGYGILQMYLRYLTIEDRIRPGDLVILTPITPDLVRGPETLMLNRRSFIFSSESEALPQYPVYSRGRIRQVKIHSPEGYWNILTYMAPYTSVLWKPFREIAEGTPLQKSAEILRELKKRVEARGAKFVLILFPLMDECVNGRYDYDLKAFQYYSMLDYCPSDEATMDAYQIPEDGHPTVLGHYEAARHILKILLAGDFLDERSVKTPP